jgi:hypothetical protein
MKTQVPVTWMKSLMIHGLEHVRISSKTKAKLFFFASFTTKKPIFSEPLRIYKAIYTICVQAAVTHLLSNL